MYGAIFGDIIGSRFEFDRGGKTKDFTLFTADDDFTDDTVMTVAVAEGLMKAGKDASVTEIRRAVTAAMRAWGQKYPNAGYGGNFYRWLFVWSDPRPYGSYGNGSAMRVSAAGWLYDTLERTREVARATADVTHNHPEGIKGAECTAAVIFLARTGASKDEIRDYVVREFGYNVSTRLRELRKQHRHDESCQDALPKALVSFFAGKSFEDVVRNAVSLGGDTDTIAAIAGSMAEAYYGVPIGLTAEGLKYLPEDMLEVIGKYEKMRVNDHASKGEQERRFGNNRFIKLAVARLAENPEQENLFTVLGVLTKRVKEDGEAIAPMVDVNQVMRNIDLNQVCVGDSITLDSEMRLIFETLQDEQGREWIPLFTDEKELKAGETANVRINVPIRSILESGLTSERAEGVVINPFGQSMVLDKQLLQMFLGHVDEIE